MTTQPTRVLIAPSQALAIIAGELNRLARNIDALHTAATIAAETATCERCLIAYDPGTTLAHGLTAVHYCTAATKADR